MSVTDITKLYNYHKKRQEIGTVSYTHLDVYKRQTDMEMMTSYSKQSKYLYTMYLPLVFS